MVKTLVDKKCKTHGLTPHFIDHANLPVCKLCFKKQQKESIKRKKLKLLELLGGECQLCGYKKCNNALDFHHIDRKTKETGIAIGLSHCSFAKCIEEINKTILLCVNCHREVEYGFKEIPQKLIENRLNNKIKFTGHLGRTSKNIYNKICESCNKQFYTDNIKQVHCCSKCRGGLKIEPVSKEEIINDLQNGMAYSKMTEKYKISTTTLIKWMKNYNINRADYYKKKGN